ncbi:copper-binding protein [Massilia cavernae]|uniref:RND transporter n=1 Tax=Massilia cavernae TaxID=2320864 RepID=A0A418Y8C2_9BURK|nr:copper-binding protein [Massilia cavernae]RJG27614.1 RND transporter [Massilia cavernae]
MSFGASVATETAPTPTATAAAALVAGEVKKVDKEAGKLTVKHGPLASLDMPAMTMVFRVKEPAMLDQVKPGDKINFAAERVNGQITVTRLEAAK